MSTIFIAEFKYGGYNIGSVTVIKETAKQYRVDRNSFQSIHGNMYVPSVVNKQAFHTFVTLRQARIWCLNEIHKDWKRLQEQMDVMRKMTDALEAEIRSTVP